MILRLFLALYWATGHFMKAHTTDRFLTNSPETLKNSISVLIENTAVENLILQFAVQHLETRKGEDVRAEKDDRPRRTADLTVRPTGKVSEKVAEPKFSYHYFVN